MPGRKSVPGSSVRGAAPANEDGKDVMQATAVRPAGRVSEARSGTYVMLERPLFAKKPLSVLDTLASTALRSSSEGEEPACRRLAVNDSCPAPTSMRHRLPACLPKPLSEEAPRGDMLNKV